MSSRFEITGTFLGEHFACDNPDGTRFIIGSVELADGTQLDVKGEAAEGALNRGMLYRMYGREMTHPKYGTQFAFSDFVVERPAGQKAVTVYLQQCQGIGTIVAKRLWDAFGYKAVEVLRTDPEKAAEQVQGLSIDKAKAAAVLLSAKARTERAKMDIMEVLQGRGFPKKTADVVLKDFGSAAADRIRENPYLLMRYRGCGFLGTDKMYLDLGKPPGKLKRQALCAWNSIFRNSNGDTWFCSREVKDALERSISGTEVKTDKAIRLACRAHLLDERKDSCNTTWFAENGKANQESRVARYVADVMEEDETAENWGVLWPHVVSLDISDHQKEQVDAALQRRWGILAGRPGTGKSYSTAAIIKALLGRYKTDDIAVCAPTGKAAVRITEVMQAAGVPIQATTIHSLLKVMANDGGGWSFQYGEGCPLPHQFIFADEMSMLDCGLAASFFGAIGPRTHLLLIGDTNQLAPVGHGAPLRDLIDAGLPCGELLEIRRNSGRIVQTCSEIVDRRTFTPSPKLDLETGENLVHVECNEAEKQIDVLESFYQRLGEKGEHDLTWDVQVVVAVNKKSPLGRKPLNKRLQQLLNPNGITAPGSPFRVGDKIINTKNGWFPSVMPESDPVNAEGKVYVANGEQGEVLQVEQNKTVVRLAAPDRTILIPRGTQDDETREMDDEGEAAENSDQQKTDTGCSWELGFAISCHKSQGSEWPIVIVLADEYPGARMIQSRNWLYTALSRAKKFCVVIGQRTVVNDMLRRDGMRRKTFLVERVAEERERIRGVRIAEDSRAWTDEIWGEVLEGVG